MLAAGSCRCMVAGSSGISEGAVPILYVRAACTPLGLPQSPSAWHRAAWQAGVAAAVECNDAVTPGWKVSAEVSALLPTLCIFSGVNEWIQNKFCLWDLCKASMSTDLQGFFSTCLSSQCDASSPLRFLARGQAEKSHPHPCLACFCTLCWQHHQQWCLFKWQWSCKEIIGNSVRQSVHSSPQNAAVFSRFILCCASKVNACFDRGSHASQQATCRTGHLRLKCMLVVVWGTRWFSQRAFMSANSVRQSSFLLVYCLSKQTTQS